MADGMDANVDCHHAFDSQVLKHYWGHTHPPGTGYEHYDPDVYNPGDQFYKALLDVLHVQF
jgi:hypothetical protein